MGTNDNILPLVCGKNLPQGLHIPLLHHANGLTAFFMKRKIRPTLFQKVVGRVTLFSFLPLPQTLIRKDILFIKGRRLFNGCHTPQVRTAIKHINFFIL